MSPGPNDSSHPPLQGQIVFSQHALEQTLPFPQEHALQRLRISVRLAADLLFNLAQAHKSSRLKSGGLPPALSAKSMACGCNDCRVDLVMCTGDPSYTKSQGLLLNSSWTADSTDSLSTNSWEFLARETLQPEKKIITVRSPSLIPHHSIRDAGVRTRWAKRLAANSCK